MSAHGNANARILGSENTHRLKDGEIAQTERTDILGERFCIFRKIQNWATGGI